MAYAARHAADWPSRSTCTTSRRATTKSRSFKLGVHDDNDHLDDEQRNRSLRASGTRWSWSGDDKYLRMI